jgi:hypothetical protein
MKMMHCEQESFSAKASRHAARFTTVNPSIQDQLLQHSAHAVAAG